MYLDSNPDNNAVEKVALFEAMLNEKKYTFFNSDDFELIIDYYFKVNFLEKAKIALDLALEQYPNDLSILLLKVDFLNGKQSFKESLHILLKLNKFYPNNIDVIFALAKVYSILELINEAISLFSQVYELIKLDSNQEDLLKDLAYELMQIQQNLFAIKVLKHILKINPLDETSMLELGVAFHDAGKFREAIIYFTFKS